MITRGGRCGGRAGGQKFSSYYKINWWILFIFYRHDLCAWAIYPIYFFATSHKRPFSKMAAYKACGHDNLRTVGWIALKFGMVVLHVFLIIWLPFGMNLSKTKWLPQPFRKMTWWSWGAFFSLFLDIDGHSLRLRGPAINWWLFCIWRYGQHGI